MRVFVGLDISCLKSMVIELPLFVGLSYSAVAKVYHRFSAEAKTDKPLRKIVKELRVDLSSVKG